MQTLKKKTKRPSVTEQNNKLKNELTALREANKRLEERSNEITESNNTIASKAIHIESELRKAISEKKTLTQQLDGANSRGDQLEDQIKNLREKNENQFKILSDKDKETEELLQRVTLAEQNYNAAHTEIEQLASRYKELERDFQGIQKEYETIRAAALQFKDATEQLGNEKRKLSRVCSEWMQRCKRTEHWLDLTEQTNRELHKNNALLVNATHQWAKRFAKPWRYLWKHLVSKIPVETVYVDPTPRSEMKSVSIERGISPNGHLPDLEDQKLQGKISGIIPGNADSKEA